MYQVVWTKECKSKSKMDIKLFENKGNLPLRLKIIYKR